MPIRNIYEAVGQDKRVREGEGTCNEAALFPGAELQSALQGIGTTIIHPGSSIGVHPHDDNEEIYMIVSGHGVATLDGREVQVRPGDVMVNHPGGSHGLRNDGQEELRIFAFAVKV